MIFPAAMHFSEAALSLAISRGTTATKAHVLKIVAQMELTIGDYSASQMHAYEAQRLGKISANMWREASAAHIEASC